MNAAGERELLPDRAGGLWALVAAPAIWAVHFLASYVTAAIWCAKLAGPGSSFAPLRTTILVYTALALAGIAVVGWRGWRRLRPHDGAAAGSHRFLGAMAAMLAGLSAVAVLFVWMAAVLGSRR